MKKIKKILIDLNLIKGHFVETAFIYLNKNKQVVDYPTDYIKWLSEIKVYCYKKHKDKKMFEKANKLYPKYENKIYLF